MHPSASDLFAWKIDRSFVVAADCIVGKVILSRARSNIISRHQREICQSLLYHCSISVIHVSLLTCRKKWVIYPGISFCAITISLRIYLGQILLFAWVFRRRCKKWSSPPERAAAATTLKWCGVWISFVVAQSRMPREITMRPWDKPCSTENEEVPFRKSGNGRIRWYVMRWSAITETSSRFKEHIPVSNKGVRVYIVVFGIDLLFSTV